MARPAILVEDKRKRGRPRKVLAAEKPVISPVKPGYIDSRPRSGFSSNNGSAIGCSRDLRSRPAKILWKEAETVPATLPLPLPLEPVCLSRRRIDLSSSVEQSQENYNGCRGERPVIPSKSTFPKLIRIRVADPEATDSDSDDDDNDGRPRPPKVYIREIQIPFRIRSSPEATLSSASDEVKTEYSETKLKLTSTPLEREREPPSTNTPHEEEPEPPLTDTPEPPLTNTPREERTGGEPEAPLMGGVPEEEETREWKPKHPSFQLHRREITCIVKEMEKGVKRKRRTPRLYSCNVLAKPASSLPSSSPMSVLDVFYDIPGPIPELSDLYTICMERFFDDLSDFDL
ncbi:hypothetical protein H6P81_004961 [Aristolochia fimbriata]|uniref:Uncharacterized protein n=1 Tax=Aristolochia fimbriata TaxID=158543 RepID=A0AAV7EWP1_ARIFI|nr:hypothetical protein H6P81_004961 [Aristolochia fimbriata]